MTVVGAEEKMVGYEKILDTKRLGILFLKHISHHLSQAPALSAEINYNVKEISVSYICHIEIMMCLRKFTIVNILGWTPY